MSSLFTNEFYEHLYRLEQYNTELTSWTKVVSDDNPDLLFCQRFIQKNLKIDDIETKKIDNIIEEVRECIAQGITSYKKISSIIGITEKVTIQLIERYGLVNELEYTKRLYHGIISHNTKTGELVFARTTKALAKHINATSAQVVRNAISCQKQLMGCKIYKAQYWKMVYPAFSLPQEEVLNNEIIRIA